MGGQESEGLLAELLAITVDEGDHGAEDGGSSGGAGEGVDLAANDDIVVVTEGGNIRIGTTLLGELAGGGHVGA